MKVFPHILLRIAGIEFDKLDTLNAADSYKVTNKIIGTKSQASILKNEICDSLYYLMPEIKDTAVQNLLLNFKRDIFNERKLHTERIAEIIKYLPESLMQKVDAYMKYELEVESSRSEGEILFSNEIDFLRGNFKTIVGDERLQKGLVLSSQSLFDRSKSYFKKEKAELNKDDFRTEQSLIKYISRMCAKTSPFSTFTNLVMCTGNEQNIAGDNSFLILNKEKDKLPKVISHIRINNLLFQYLKGLIGKTPELSQWFLLRPNPTIKKIGEDFVFLTNCNNVESFQRIPANPALDVFLILAKNKNEGIRFKTLVKEVVDNEYIDAPAEDIEEFILQLIEYGFLEYNWGISGIDPDWDLKLVDKLNQIEEKPSLAVKLIETLKALREYALIYGKESIEKRKEILDEAYKQFKSVCMELHEIAGLPEDERMEPEERKKFLKEKEKEEKEQKDLYEGGAEKNENENNEDAVFKHQFSSRFNFKPEQMFYEDTTLNIKPGFNIGKIERFVSVIDSLMQLMNSLVSLNDEKEKMFNYFAQKYTTGETVDILRFYEDYYKDFKKPEAEKLDRMKKKSRENLEKKKDSVIDDGSKISIDKENEKIEDKEIPLPSSIKLMQERSKLWQNTFASDMERKIDGSKDNIAVSKDQIQDTFKKTNLEEESEISDSSFGVFVQIYVEKKDDGESRLVGVVNNVMPGFGKFISRFLHLFNDDVTQNVRTWNQSLRQDAVLAEDCDESHFNANLHPPLMPYEVWLPGSQNSLPADKQIPVTELHIKADHKSNVLKLYHSVTDKEVLIFDMGFQSILGRSHLFQILEKFSLTKMLYWAPLLMAINEGSEEKKSKHLEDKNDKMTVRPRITYENCLILQRKAWFIPKTLLPIRKPNESDWQYFERINEWKSNNMIPDEVFVFIINRNETEVMEAKDLKKLSRDDYKPQYISFKNPFLVDLFSKLLNKVPGILKIEEMLPDSNHLLCIDEKRFVGEFVIQWYKSSNN